MIEKNDKKLIIRYLGGDEESLELLIARYLKPIYSFAYKYTGNQQDAEDITQTTFIKAWKHLKRFDRKKSFKTWIFSIAKNTCIDWMRKKKSIYFSDTETLISQASLPDDLSERASITQILQSAAEKLLPKYRLVLSFYYNENLNFREIAERLGEPLNTVKSRHRRALIKLKTLLKDF